MSQTNLANQLQEDAVPKRRLTGIFIPPQPQILVDLQMEQLMPDPDLKEIARLINADPGLAGSVLKAANFQLGPGQRVASVIRAAELLGCDAVIDIINGLSIKSELGDEEIQCLNVFWDTANDVAKAASLIAKHLGDPAPDQAYTLGLFHNCGIVLLMKAHENYNDLMKKSYAMEVTQGRRLIDLENDLLRTNHAVLGYYTAKSWHVPQHICDVIADHHTAEAIFTLPTYSEYGPEKKNLLGILKMAEHMCKLFERLGEHSEDLEWAQVQRPILEHLCMSEYDFEALTDAVRDQL